MKALYINSQWTLSRSGPRGSSKGSAGN